MVQDGFAGVRLLMLTAALAVACSQEQPPELPACYVPVGSSPTRGPTDAWVTIVEFGDFQCPYCGDAESTISKVDIERPLLVRWVWKEYPLTSIHARAMPTAIAAECAHAQGLFWNMHDLLFANRGAQTDTDILAYAQQIGLDVTTWQACLVSDAPKQRIADDRADASNARVAGTPTFFVNGVAVVGAVSLDELLPTIDAAQQSAQASGIAAPNFYSIHESEGCL
jgi:protein-disulfide isomerase